MRQLFFEERVEARLFLGEKVLEDREKNAANLRMSSLDKKMSKKADAHNLSLQKSILREL